MKIRRYQQAAGFWAIIPAALILFLFILPAPALAANTFPPTRDISQRENATYIWNTTVEPYCCPWLTYQYCADNKTLVVNTDSTLFQFTGYGADGNATYSVYDYASMTTKTCQNGCSLQLNGCREPPITELAILVAFAFVAGLLIYYAPRLGPIGVFVSLLLVIISLALSLTDYFSDPMLMFARLLTFVLTVFACINFYMASKSPPEGDEEGVVNA